MALTLVLALLTAPLLCDGATWADIQQYILKVEPVHSGVTCWTCPNMTDNEQCNDWAPDKLCHKDYSVCKTVHLLDAATGVSMAVTKTCAAPAECTPDHVGCRHTFLPGVRECVSCCTESYCNEAVPSDHISAIELSSVSAGGALTSCAAMMVLTTLLLVL